MKKNEAVQKVKKMLTQNGEILEPKSINRWRNERKLPFDFIANGGLASCTFEECWEEVKDQLIESLKARLEEEYQIKFEIFEINPEADTMEFPDGYERFILTPSPILYEKRTTSFVNAIVWSLEMAIWSKLSDVEGGPMEAKAISGESVICRFKVR